MFASFDKSLQEGQDGPVSLTRLPDKLESTGFSVQEKKFNIAFKDGGHLGFPIRMILATFDLQVTSILPMAFRLNCPFGSGEKVQNRFSMGCYGNHLGFLIRMVLFIFYLQVISMLPIKF